MFGVLIALTLFHDQSLEKKHDGVVLTPDQFANFFSHVVENEKLLIAHIENEYLAEGKPLNSDKVVRKLIEGLKDSSGLRDRKLWQRLRDVSYIKYKDNVSNKVHYELLARKLDFYIETMYIIDEEGVKKRYFSKDMKYPTDPKYKPDQDIADKLNSPFGEEKVGTKPIVEKMRQIIPCIIIVNGQEITLYLTKAECDALQSS